MGAQGADGSPQGPGLSGLQLPTRDSESMTPSVLCTQPTPWVHKGSQQNVKTCLKENPESKHVSRGGCKEEGTSVLSTLSTASGIHSTRAGCGAVVPGACAPY